MAEINLLTGRLISAARALTGVSRDDLAKACGMSVSSLGRLEASGSAVPGPQVDTQALKRALEGFGVMFVPESDGIGAGVRLRFLRQDVKQIGRLENEGGNVADDDVP